jgi:glycosyltransferase involved in cell wall biosynthesis
VKNSSALPEISVLMCVYNGEAYLTECLESIQNQSFSDFEFIIVDDGSTDRSLEILNSYAQKDARITLVSQTENAGITSAVTEGLKHCRGKYIARMDQDDISLPDRLRVQHDFLVTHPEIDALGAGFDFIDEEGKYISSFPTRPMDPMILRHQMLYHCVLHNPTVMMRAEFYRKYNSDNQEESFFGADDYHFWLRENFDHLYSNIPERLLLYRLHSVRVSNQYSDIQLDSILRSAHEAFEKLLRTRIPIEVINTLYFPNRYEAKDQQTIRNAFRVIYQVQRIFEKQNHLTKIQKRATREFSFEKLMQLVAKYQRNRLTLFTGSYYLFLLSPDRLINAIIEKTNKTFSKLTTR